MYNLIVFILLIMFTPTRLRGEMMKSLLEAISVPLQTIVDKLIAFRARKTYEMAISSQIIYMEKMLNDKFNPSGLYTPIYITDALVTDEKVYIGQMDEEEGGVYVGQKWIPGVSLANTDDKFLFEGITWKSLIDDNTTVPEEGANWTELANDEIVYVGHIDEYSSPYTFIVHISQAHYNAITSQIDEMTSHINKYKLLGTKYIYDVYEEI